MSTYRLQQSGVIVDTSTLGLVTLGELRDRIVNGEHIQVFEGDSSKDITNGVLLRILSMESARPAGAVDTSRALEELIREQARSSTGSESKETPLDYDDETLDTWMRETMRYHELLSENFGRRFCTNQFARVIGVSASLYWRDLPIESGVLIDRMTRGSRNTRLDRISRLVEIGWFEKVKQTGDHRKILLQPTVNYRSLIDHHYSQTLAFAIALVDELTSLSTDVQELVSLLVNGSNSAERRKYLVRWADFVVDGCEKWADGLFGYKYVDLEYVLILTHTVISRLRNKPLTFEKLMSLSRFASPRVMKDRLKRCEDENFVKTVKSEADRRVLVYVPSPNVEVLVKKYYAALLNDFRALVGEFGYVPS